MDNWKKFVEDTLAAQEILQKYLELRLMFQELGYTEKQLERISSGPERMFEIRAEIAMLVRDLKKQLKGFGFDIQDEDLMLYLQSKMNKIDLLTPLIDGSKERDD
jgi:hypothetical protein